MGELVRSIGATNYIRTDQPPASDEIFDMVEKLVSEQMGVREAEIGRRTRFMEDLNMG